MALSSATSCCFFLLLALLVISAFPDSSDHGHYKDGDNIPLFANTVFPTEKPCKATSYYDLPFCPPGVQIIDRKKTFDEVVAGDCFTATQYELRFKKDKVRETLCEKNLTDGEVAKFRNAVRHEYAFEMYGNNIRVEGKVGNTMAALVNHSITTKYYVCKHLIFHAYFMEDRVIALTVACDIESQLDVTEDACVKVNFTYSVYWKEFEENLLSKPKPIEVERWEFTPLFISRAFVILAWELFFFYLAIRYLSDYLTRYSNRDMGDGSHWRVNMRQLHGDGCRCPPYTALFGAILGVGTQMLIMICSLLFLHYQRILNPCGHEALFAQVVFLYGLTSAIAGFIASSFHLHYTDIGLKECIFQTGALYFVPVFIVVAHVNVVLTMGERISSFPKIGIAASELVLWGIIPIPMLLIGGKVGHVCQPEFRAPCNTSGDSRETRELSWYMRTPAQMLLGGLPPFLLLYRGMDSFYASLWNLKICHSFLYLFLYFVLTIAITIKISTFLVYLWPSRQGNTWWWRSVLRGGSTAIFMFFYGIYFQLRRGMGNTIADVLFLCYNACLFYALFLVLGTVSFFATFLALRHVNDPDKIE